jgi:hypothetical protein
LDGKIHKKTKGKFRKYWMVNSMKKRMVNFVNTGW